MFKLKDLDRSLALYNKALETDKENELSLANKSLIELKKEKSDLCLGIFVLQLQLLAKHLLMLMYFRQ